ncbi:MAG: hypothetical protein JWO53_592 [Chlamydiia bacterium]|nr:hypothetical protein [Chlamydiia bacterium]
MLRKKHQNITLSLSQPVVAELHFYLPDRGISKFVEEAVVEKLAMKKKLLEQQYIEAAQDSARNEVFNEWEHLSGEGLDEENTW